MSAPFICEFFMDRLESVLPFVDWIFGNETEAMAFAQKKISSSSSSNPSSSIDPLENIPSIIEIGKMLSDNKRKVILTQGSKETIVIMPQNLVLKFPVHPIEESEIVDTNGAGDAFVGGFLSQLLLEKELDECIRVGHYAANITIRQSGIQVPKHQPRI